jgi:protein-S-isoprenylcysteine O-methyltransferase Ste14
MLLCTLATPVVLGTSWGFVPATLLSGVIVARTTLEDRTLREELIGYRAYADRVRYRLMPRLW